MKKGAIMKKAMSCSMVLCFVLSGATLAGIVDDFDSYAIGTVDTVTSNWRGIASPALTVIREDPLDSSNQVLAVTESNNNNGVYGILSGDAIIPNGATKTLFLRIFTPVSSPTAPNTAFGLIDLMYRRPTVGLLFPHLYESITAPFRRETVQPPIGDLQGRLRPTRGTMCGS